MTKTETSQNGWPVCSGYSDPSLTNSKWVTGKVKSGLVAQIFDYIGEQFNARVEKIDKASSWGYAPRNIIGSGTISNHASGTAEDYNAPKHPLGKRGTFTPDQVKEINKILAEVDHVVRWGGHYTGRADEMHFEIVGSFDDLKKVVLRLTNKTPAVQQEEEAAMIYRYKGDNGIGVLGANGGWVTLTSKSERDSLLQNGVREVWLNEKTLAYLMNDSRGLLRFPDSARQPA